MLEFLVKGTEIFLTHPEVIASKSVGVLKAKFVFENLAEENEITWDGLSKCGVFEGKDGKPYKQALTDGICEVPWEALTEAGDLIVSAFGLSGNVIVKTTHQKSAGPILEGADTDAETPPEHTPSLYEQCVTLMQKQAVDAQTATEQAEIATTKAGEASTSAGNASVSEQHAKSSEDTALLIKTELSTVLESETARNEAEQERVTAEELRETADNERQVKFNEFDTRITANAAKIDELTTQYTYANLLNTSDSNYATGYYIGTTNGVLGANAAYNTSGYIPVSKGDRIYLTSLLLNRYVYDMRYVVAFDSTKTFKDGLSATNAYYYDVPDGVSYLRITYHAVRILPMIEKENGFGTSKEYLEYGELVSASQPICDIDVYLPDIIYVAVGVTIELYSRAVCPLAYKSCKLTCDAQSAPYSTIKVSDRKISITGNSLGYRSTRFEIFNENGNLVYAKWLKIQTIAGLTSAKAICPIGDSETNSKPWLAEMIKYNNNITYVGSKSFSVLDSGGTSRTGKHEGHSGWAAVTYYTLPSSTASGSLEINPFWDTTLNGGLGGFSWNYYLSNTLLGVAPDIVQIFLGMNGLQEDPTENAGYIKNIVDAIRSDAPTIPIMLCTPQYQDYSVAYNAVIWTFNLMAKLTELLGNYSSLYIIPLGIMHDSEYNYVNGTTTVNPRSPITQNAVTDPVHPQVQGFFQMADIMYSIYSAH